jgi:hypothetical protein
MKNFINYITYLYNSAYIIIFNIAIYIYKLVYICMGKCKKIDTQNVPVDNPSYWATQKL